MIYPIEHAAEVFGLVERMFKDAPDDLGIGLAVSPLKPLLMFLEELHWRPEVMVGLCWSGDPSKGERIIAQFRKIAPPLLDFILPVHYADLQKSLDLIAPKGRRAYWKAGYLQSINSDVGKRFAKYGGAPLSPYSQVISQVLDAAFGRIASDATAFGDRSGSAVYNVECFWQDPEADSANIEWARTVFKDFERHSTGTAYVNFLSQEGHERVRSAYSARSSNNHDRLTQIKGRLDPDNFFRLNQNIIPAKSKSIAATAA